MAVGRAHEAEKLQELAAQFDTRKSFNLSCSLSGLKFKVEALFQMFKLTSLISAMYRGKIQEMAVLPTNSESLSLANSQWM